MNFNLLPWREIAHKKRIKQLLIELSCCLLLILIITQIVNMTYAHFILQQKRAIAKLQQQIEILQPDYLTYLALVDKNKNHDLQIQVISSAIAHYEMVINFLAKMGVGIPEETRLTQLHISNNLLQLEGESTSHINIAGLLKYLETLNNKAQPLNSETKYDENNASIHFLISYSLPFAGR